jgi:diaminohydroxyphosphoribosylaminopyrimidine deaminase/5-amino-6-(5-phosphoribosylamino)uracil reductase
LKILLASSVPATSLSEAGDPRFMRVALALARRGEGTTWPNPSIGCVLVRNGQIVGRGWTRTGGRPHAETEALRRAGAAAKGATAYVTLEPCAHQGQTGPCADALITAGVARVVVALSDPDPRVNGAGIDRLRGAGVAITMGMGVGEGEAQDFLAGYLMRTVQGRPLVALKLAATLDGKIATHHGHSKWITAEAARARGQLLRARFDATAVGVGTATSDDPELVCRLPGLEGRPRVRIVFDSHLRLPLTSRLVRGAAERATWLVVSEDADAVRLQAYRDSGVEIIAVKPGPDRRPELGLALREFARRGLTQVLFEGGSHLAAALVRDDLVDRLYWFRAPRLIGGDGLSAVAGLGLVRIDQSERWSLLDSEPIGDDLLETFARPF